MKRLLIVPVALAVVCLPADVDAHHPVISVTAGCRLPDQPWSATWTVESDGPWSELVQVTSPGYSPSGWQPVDAEFTRTASYPAAQPSASEAVAMEWSNGVTDTRTGTADRPPLCPEQTTTTTTTTVPSSTTITEAPPSSTTTPASAPSPTTATTPPSSTSTTPASTAAPAPAPTSSTSSTTIPAQVGLPPVPKPDWPHVPSTIPTPKPTTPPTFPIEVWETPHDTIVRTTWTAAPTPDQELPATGGDSDGTVTAAGLLLLAGAGAVAASRRRGGAS